MTEVCIACYFYSVVTKLLSFTQTGNCNVFISEHYRILCYINFFVHNYWNFRAASTFPTMFLLNVYVAFTFSYPHLLLLSSDFSV